jgi:hypothetical protein
MLDSKPESLSDQAKIGPFAVDRPLWIPLITLFKHPLNLIRNRSQQTCRESIVQPAIVHLLNLSSMRLLIQLIGLALMLLGIYFLGKNIFFTTNVSPYWWRGIAADASIFLLVGGICLLVFMPLGFMKQLGWVFVAGGIVCIFISSRAILNPTSLWQFFVSIISMTFGYRLLATGRLPL